MHLKSVFILFQPVTFFDAGLTQSTFLSGRLDCRATRSNPEKNQLQLTKVNLA
jgi:hypothetical protein